jgi:methionyl-tRNA synthetase
MDRYLLHEGAAAAFELISAANGFVETRAPWKLAKDAGSAGELDHTLSALVRTLGFAAVLLTPFMPEKMKRLWEELGTGQAMPRLSELEGIDARGWRPSKGMVLFPRPEIGSPS